MDQNQDQLCCSICLDLLREPVSLPCGHNYCSGCIEGYWNDQRGRFSCPQCRETFRPRPVLKKNTMLAEVVESLKKTRLQGAPPDHCYAGPGDVACDSCTGRKQRKKAVKTCLQCRVSYCDFHLQPHYQSPAFKKHELVKASGELLQNICSRHDEVKKLFCRTDQQCVCYLCSMEEHKGHNIISAATERTERQKELDMSHQNIEQRLQEREKDVKTLHQEVESMNHRADRAVENIDATFTELISSIEETRSEVRNLIRNQQKHEVGRAEDARRRVEQEVTELRRRRAELEQISHTEDHIHFLERFTSLPAVSESMQPVSSNVHPLSYFGDVFLEMIIKGLTACFNVIYFMFVILYYPAITFLALLSFIFCFLWLVHVLDIDPDVEPDNQPIIAKVAYTVAVWIGLLVFIVCYKSGPASIEYAFKAFNYVMVDTTFVLTQTIELVANDQ